MTDSNKAETPALDLQASAAPLASPKTDLVREIVQAASDAPAAPPASAPIRARFLRGPSPLKLLIKLADVMADLNWVEKRGHNAHFNYDYATESDILAAIRPRLAEKKIFVQTLVQKESESPTGKKTRDGADIFRNRVELLIIFHDAESGETMDIIGIGYSQDDADKGFYKAYTGAIKYAFAKTFLISTGDDPEEAGTPEEREAAKKAKKEKQAAAKTNGPGQGGPQRSGDHVQTDENGAFTVTSLIEKYTTKPVSGNNTQVSFQIPNVGNASTIDRDLAAKLMREKGTGMLVRWKLTRKGSFINIASAEILAAGLAS